MVLKRIRIIWVIGGSGKGDSICLEAVCVECRVYEDDVSFHQRDSEV